AAQAADTTAPSTTAGIAVPMPPPDAPLATQGSAPHSALPAAPQATTQASPPSQPPIAITLASLPAGPALAAAPDIDVAIAPAAIAGTESTAPHSPAAPRGS